MGDYRHFHDDILRLHKALAGRAMLTSYEGLRGQSHRRWAPSIAVHVQATAEGDAGQKLGYGFEIDQSFLPAIAADISQLFLCQARRRRIRRGPEAGTAPRRRLITMRSCRSAMKRCLLPVRVKRRGQQPVQETGDPAQDHAQAEAPGRRQMLARQWRFQVLTDRGRMLVVKEQRSSDMFPRDS